MAYCSGAGISWQDMMEMTDVQVAACILIIQEIQERERGNSEE